MMDTQTPVRQSTGVKTSLLVGALFVAALALAAVVSTSKQGKKAGTDGTTSIPQVTTVEGVLEVSIVDYFATGTSETLYVLRIDTGGSVKLRFDGKPPELVTGMRVRVTGPSLDQTITASGETGIEILSTPPSITVTGMQRVAVVLFTFTNNPPGTLPTPDSVRAAVFTNPNSVAAYYSEVSYGSVTIAGRDHPTGDVYGWIQVDYDNTNCDFTNFDGIARDNSIDFTGYEKRIFMIPWTVGCAAGGSAVIGGDTATIFGSFSTLVIGHELGHTFGAHHAGGLNCTQGGQRVPIGGTCTLAEYYDPFDIMGNLAARLMNVYHRGQLGWLGASNTYP